MHIMQYISARIFLLSSIITITSPSSSTSSLQRAFTLNIFLQFSLISIFKVSVFSWGTRGRGSLARKQSSRQFNGRQSSLGYLCRGYQSEEPVKVNGNARWCVPLFGIHTLTIRSLRNQRSDGPGEVMDFGRNRIHECREKARQAQI
jgi:hypothetical protein